jgi:hypothetical protein
MRPSIWAELLLDASYLISWMSSVDANRTQTVHVLLGTYDLLAFEISAVS